LLGLGAFGPEFMSYLNEVAEVVAVCDPNPKAIASYRRKFGESVPALLDYEQMFDQADLEVLIGGIGTEYLRPSLVKLYLQDGFDFLYIEYEHSLFSPTTMADTVLCARDDGYGHHFRIAQLALTIFSMPQRFEQIVTQAVYLYNLGVHRSFLLVS
jgi:hypothetical protein